MAIKVNLVYRDNVYKVKGMKVICSVVASVITILFIIMTLGVWLLANVYSEIAFDKIVTSNSSELLSNTSKSSGNYIPPLSSTEYKIKRNSPTKNKNLSSFKLPDSIRAPSQVEVHSYVPKMLTFPRAKVPGPKLENGFVPVRKYIISDESSEHSDPKKERDSSKRIYLISRPSSDFHEEPESHEPVEIINIHLKNRANEKHNLKNSKQFKPFSENDKNIPPETVIDFKTLDKNNFTKGSKQFIQNEKLKNQILLSRVLPHLRKSRNNKTYSSYSHYRHRALPSTKLDLEKIFDTKQKIVTDDFQDNSKMSEKAYEGPPVVGYGLKPYSKLTDGKLEDFNNFWSVYGDKKHKNRRVLVKRKGDRSENFKIESNNRPLLRGLKSRKRTKTNTQASNKVFKKIGVAQAPVIRRRIRPFRTYSASTEEPNKFNEIKSPDSIESEGQAQNLYDYSKKIAASLLTFNANPLNEVKYSTDTLAKYGLNLLGSFNNVFPNVSSGPFYAFSSLIPGVESLRALDPFELSLMTWTFLDFWEFLIEKVGTLTGEDLRTLQQRLNKLKQRKDSAFTKSIVNETIQRYPWSRYRELNKENDFEAPVALPLIANPTSEVVHKTFIDLEIQALENLFPDINSTISAWENDNDIIKGKVSTKKFDEVNTEDYEIKEKNSPSHEIFENVDENIVLKVKDGNITKYLPKILVNSSNQLKGDRISTEKTLITKEEKEKIEGVLDILRNHIDTIDYDDEIFGEEFEARNILGNKSSNISHSLETGRSAWNTFQRLFSSQGKMKYMTFIAKVVFNFGKVFFRKPYALDCMMLLFCKDINKDSKKGGIESLVAKLKSVGLKVLTESDQELRDTDALGDVWRSLTAWQPLQCDAMFPKCDGPKALEIVNEVAMGGEL